MNRRLVLAQYIGFTTLGMVTCIVGPLIPAIRNDIGITMGQAGILLSSPAVGMMLAVLVGGYLSDRLNKKIFLLSGSLLLFLGLAGSMLSNGFILLLSFNFIAGIGSGVYEIGINSLCADLNTVNKGKAMNFLHFFFGLGAVAGPVLATLCINYFKMWRLTFGIVALFPVIVSVILLPLSIQQKQEETDNKNTAKTPYKELFLWLAGISIFLYVGIETSMYGWCSTFWSENFSNDIIPASLIATIFWTALTIGRLICGKITDRAGFSTYITSAGLVTMLSALIWCLFPNRIPTLLVNLAAGLAISGIYPTILASVTSIYPNDSGKVTALITIFASLAGCLMPSVIGRIADFYQITVLPIIVLVLSILLSLCTYLTWNVVLRHRSENLAEAVKAGNP